MISSLAVFTYINEVKPYKSELLNLIEMLNELLIFALSYLALSFSDFKYDLSL